MAVSWPDFVLGKDMLQLHDDMLVRSVVASLVRSEILHLIWQLPSLLHFAICQEALHQRWLLARVLPINRLVDLAFDVSCEGVAIITKFLEAARLLLQSFKIGQSLNFPQRLFKTLIVADLPVVLFLQHLHAVQSFDQNLTCLKQCVLQYFVVNLGRYLGLLGFLYLQVTTVLVSFARWELFIFVWGKRLAQSFLPKIFAGRITCWCKLNGFSESIGLVLVLL